MNKAISSVIFLLFFQTVTLSGQEFILKKVDMPSLIKIAESDSLHSSLIYHYINSNYGPPQEIDSVKIEPDSSYSLCAYYQTFKYEISYSVDFCGEKPTVTETVSLPKTDLKKIQEFVETIEFTEGNIWVKPTYYGPPEDEWNGCETFIIQTKTRSIIKTNCGC